MATNLSIDNPTTPFEELAKLIYETYLVVDPGILKLLCASVIAHRLPADPVWIFIVAGSSGGKTELLNALNDIPNVHPLDSITSNTFLSGQQRAGKETSLLHRIKNGILTMKDFTTILSMQRDARGEIFGQLRKIYDGEFSKSFGTGEDKTWRGKITLVSGVTTSIYTMGSMYADMGERFIMYAMIMPDRKEVSRRAIANVTGIDMKQRRLDIRAAMVQYIESVAIPDTMPTIAPEFQEELIALANLATLARSAVDRDYRSPNKEITFVHDSEMPTRFASQLVTLAGGLIVMNGGKLLETDKHILYKITLDSIHKIRRRCLQELTKYTKSDTAGMATRLQLPTNSVRRYLEELNALGLVDRIKESANKDIWILRDEYRQVMSSFDGIEMLSAVLDENTKEETEPVELVGKEDLEPDLADAIQNSLGFAEEDHKIEGLDY